MHKTMKFLLILLAISSVLSIFPINVYAAGNDTKAEEQCNQNSYCNDKSTALGNVNCECSTAWLLQKVLNYIRIIAPTLVIVLSSIDFTKAVITSDEEDMKKVQKKLITRLVLCVVLFFIPSLIELLLNVFGIISVTEDITQGIR